MKTRTLSCIRRAVYSSALALAGCTGISIAPTCPNEMAIGESVTITGSALNPGAIPMYAWTVDPANAGSFQPDSEPVTTFTAGRAGDATIQLTASDGVFQVQSECVTRITAAPLMVTLRASPASPVTGDAVVLTCESTATVDTFTITQTSGPTVNLTELADGQSRFDATTRGDFGFQCVGSVTGGQSSEPDTLTVTVTQGRGGR